MKKFFARIGMGGMILLVFLGGSAAIIAILNLLFELFLDGRTDILVPIGCVVFLVLAWIIGYNLDKPTPTGGKEERCSGE